MLRASSWQKSSSRYGRHLTYTLTAWETQPVPKLCMFGYAAPGPGCHEEHDTSQNLSTHPAVSDICSGCTPEIYTWNYLQRRHGLNWPLQIKLLPQVDVISEWPIWVAITAVPRTEPVCIRARAPTRCTCRHAQQGEVSAALGSWQKSSEEPFHSTNELSCRTRRLQQLGICCCTPCIEGRVHRFGEPKPWKYCWEEAVKLCLGHICPDYHEPEGAW